jgi:hypothetical protein
MDQLKAMFLAIPALFVLAVKAGLAIGSTGTVIEMIGDFLQAKFSGAKVKRVGAILVGFGRKLEALGTDIPKFVEDFRKWHGMIAKMLGVATVFFLVMSTLQACAPTPCSPSDTVMAAKAVECRARVRTECATLPDEKCPVIAECDAWGEARCGSHSGGMGGSAGAP